MIGDAIRFMRLEDSLGCWREHKKGTQSFRALRHLHSHLLALAYSSESTTSSPLIIRTDSAVIEPLPIKALALYVPL